MYEPKGLPTELGRSSLVERSLCTGTELYKATQGDGNKMHPVVQAVAACLQT